MKSESIRKIELVRDCYNEEQINQWHKFPKDACFVEVANDEHCDEMRN